LSQIACLGTHTITGLLSTAGRQFRDWTAGYRLFSHPRFEQDAIFGTARRDVLHRLPDDQPLISAIDDSILRKAGKHTPGVGWRRDPLGPPFQTNLFRAQRVLQISALLPEGPAARMIPIDFQDAPTPAKPRTNDPPECWQQYNEARRTHNLNTQAAQRLAALRHDLDADEPSRHRPLWISADGRLTNKPVLRQLPANTVFIGRIRGDARLYYPPPPLDHPVGRKPSYGLRTPTPEQLLHGHTVPWQEVTVTVSGQPRTFRIKTIAPVLWRTAGPNKPLRLIVIAPTGYRLRKGSKLLYRQPAFLICTNPELPVQAIVQTYVTRWGIEVNFRGEKQLIGVGQAQVRSAKSVQAAPALAVAAYSLLLLAAHRAGAGQPDGLQLPPPKWLERRAEPRSTTADLKREIRNELWGRGLHAHFCGFSATITFGPERTETALHLPSAVIYAPQ